MQWIYSLFQMNARIRFRRRIPKKKLVFFSAQRAHWIITDFRKKTQLIPENKGKHFEKNKFISGNKTNSSYFFSQSFFFVKKV